MSITIPNSVESLGYHCFEGCTSLKSINISSSVSKLKEYSFHDCVSLTNITIPNSIKSLENFCFEGCTSLQSITIPSSVNSLGTYCFHGCTDLKEVTCLALKPPFAFSDIFDTFDDVEKKTLYVPESALEAYKNSEYWKNFGNILPLSSSSINSIDNDNISLKSDNGKLILSNVQENETVSVFSTSGQLLCTNKGNIRVDAPSGQMVIVKIGSKCYKVLVR